MKKPTPVAISSPVFGSLLVSIFLVLAFLVFAPALEAFAPPVPGLDPGGLTLENASSDYDRLYPEYVEFCGLSQIKKKPGFGALVEGGTGGHGVLYLSGACVDTTARYPRLRPCGANERAPRGAGISVNSDFRNVNWNATQGRRFFYYGNLGDGETLDQGTYARTMTEAHARDIMRGVGFHEELFQNAPTGMSRIDYMYEDAIGTDFAISFGRNMYCARLPVASQQTLEAIRYLNELNRHYREDGIEYNWDVFTNNCTHTARNALAAAGVWRAYAVDQPLPIQVALGDLAIPVNTFANLMDRAHGLELEDPVAIFRDAEARKALLQRGWLPAQPGALAQYIPVHQLNEIYEVDLGAMIVDGPILRLVHREVDHFISDPVYTDIRADLVHFANRYADILANRHEPEWYAGRLSGEFPGGEGGASWADFVRFHRLYFDYIERQKRDTEGKLLRL